MATSDLFVSYSHRDGAEFAKELTHALRGRGFRVFLDEIILRTGDDLLGLILPEIRSSRLYIPIISPLFCDSNRWAYKEFLEALQEEAQRKQKGFQNKFIFPILHCLSGIDDPILKGNKELWQRLSDRKCVMSSQLTMIVNAIVADAGIAEDAFVDKCVNGVRAGRFPVTNVEYRRFINEGGYKNQGVDRWWSQMGQQFWFSYVARKSHDYLRTIRTEDSVVDENLTGSNLRFNAFNQPVTGVCYFEAEAYCTWLSERLYPDRSLIIRLPTEAEWLSILSPNVGQFPWGYEKPKEGIVNLLFSRRDELFSEHIDLDVASRMRYPSVYGEHPDSVSHVGCHDLIGNIWEWAGDFITPNSAHELTGDKANVAKILGNCCFDIPSRLHYPPRELRYPGYRHHVIGFRVVVAEPNYCEAQKT